jgi:hypothetical protein
MVGTSGGREELDCPQRSVRQDARLFPRRKVFRTVQTGYRGNR